MTRQIGPARAGYVVRDVDADPETRRRFGLKVPALTIDGSLVCYGHYNATAVARLLAP